MHLLVIMFGVVWLMVATASCSYVICYPKQIAQMGLTRAEVLLGGCLLPVFGWWVLLKVHQHDKRHIRRLEEERLDRELRKLGRE